MGELITKAQLKETLEKCSPDFQVVLPAHWTPQRFASTVMTAVAKNPKILECSMPSVILAVKQAAELGLDPTGGALGQGYLIPYSNKGKMELQFMPGYRGLIDLARRSGDVLDISARLVYEGDVFEVEYGATESIRHVPKFETEGAENVTFGYAVATMAGGVKHIEVMTRKQINAIRQRSRSKDNGPWVTDTCEMMRKTLVRRIIKSLALSSEKLVKAVTLSDEADGVVDGGQAVRASVLKPGRHSVAPSASVVDTEIEIDPDENSGADAPEDSTESGGKVPFD